jgi:hypothetical protein
MPTFLAEPPVMVYAVLLLAALAAVGLWVRSRKPWAMILLGVCVLLALVVFLLDRFNESPREQSVRIVTEMADSIKKKDWNTFSGHVSEKFNASGMTKNQMEAFFRLAADRYNVRATAWEFALTDPPEMSDTEVVIRFDAKAETPDGQQVFKHFTARFVKEGDRFRMVTFTPFNYVQKNTPEPFPNSVP